MEKVYVTEKAEAMQEELRDIRRALHMRPELAGKELETRGIIIKALEAEGIPWQTCADTGIVALVAGNRPGKTVAIRGDIDALPIQEESDEPYKSRNDGVMHACGHDAHATITLGAALFFARNRDFAGNIKLFFQPAEEAIGGAKRMIAQGCMENPKVDSLIGLHVMPYMDYDTVELRHGTLNASTNGFKLSVRGKRGHGAYPDACVDAIVIAAQIVVALQTLVSRSISPMDSAVLTIGTIQGGTAANIITDEVELRGTIRSSGPNVRDIMFRRLKETAFGVAAALGGACGITLAEDGYAPLVNHSSVVNVIEKQASELLGRDHVLFKETMSMGGEDFSFFIENTPGAFYHLGCRKPGMEPYVLHTSCFDIDERCLVTGVKLQALTALALLGNGE
jgi:amidohydrolase